MGSIGSTRGPGRAWYPSGPRLDGSSSSSSYSPPPRNDVQNPDLTKFTVVEVEHIGDLFVSKIRYANCVNYEGTKILITDFNPKRRTELDPHFMKDSGLIARFVPTNEGWQMAVAFARSVTR